MKNNIKAAQRAYDNLTPESDGRPTILDPDARRCRCCGEWWVPKVWQRRSQICEECVKEGWRDE